MRKLKWAVLKYLKRQNRLIRFQFPQMWSNKWVTGQTPLTLIHLLQVPVSGYKCCIFLKGIILKRRFYLFLFSHCGIWGLMEGEREGVLGFKIFDFFEWWELRQGCIWQMTLRRRFDGCCTHRFVLWTQWPRLLDYLEKYSRHILEKKSKSRWNHPFFDKIYRKNKKNK